MEKIHLGIVGLGKRGQSMFNLATQFEVAEATALCDNRSEALASMQEKYPQSRCFTDFREMLKHGGIDVLLVETPADNHAAFCAAALKQNIHVFSDIPCINTLEEAEMLWAVAEQSSALFMVGANPNLWGFVEALADLHRQGLLGEPYYLEAEYIHDIRHLFEKTPWRKTYPPIQYCTHSLGPLLRIVKDDLRIVSCFTTGSQINREMGQNDLMTAQFQTKSGVVLRLTVSFINNAGCGLHSYRVFGTEGYFERLSERGRQSARTAFKSNKFYGAGEMTELNIDMLRPEYACKATDATGHGGADYALLDQFFTALHNGAKTAPITLREGLRMSLPGLYAAESARRGGELVTIRYPWEV